MYSVVLMMALGGTADMPAWGHRGGGCCGGCYGGCSGYGCGGGHRGHRRGGGCCGGSWGGCCGGGYYSGGCCGGGYAWGGCCGGGYAAGGYGYPVYGYSQPYYRDGRPRDGYERVGPPGSRGDRYDQDRDRNKTRNKTRDGSSDEESRIAAPATVIVGLPPNAQWSVDGQKMLVPASGVATFTSPPLVAGEDYFYSIDASRDGDKSPAKVTRRVPVQAGRTVSVRLEFPQSVALNR
jgi:uncharacterized protein (TIGR03000 family)